MRQSRPYYQGFLGADFMWDEAVGGYRISAIVRGDVWSDQFCGPLVRLGLGISDGDVLVAINNRPLSKAVPPAVALANCADKEVTDILDVLFLELHLP